MTTLKAGRPSKEKENLSLADVSQKEEIQRVSFDMPISLHRELKAYAAVNGLTIRDILNKLIEEKVKQ